MGIDDEGIESYITTEEGLDNWCCYAVERNENKKGVFNKIMVPCPECGNKVEFRSKSGSCRLDTYYIESVPTLELVGILGDTKECIYCGEYIEIHDENKKVSADNFVTSFEGF